MANLGFRPPSAERESSAYQFDKKTYDILCQHSKNGELNTMKLMFSSVPAEATFGRVTFCPEEPRHSPFVLAAQYGHLSVVQYLMKNYANIIDVNYGATIVSQNSGKDIHSATALLAATLGGHTKVIKYLVSLGADVNKCTHTGSTPLRTASYHGLIDIMKCLIENGADVNRPNILGESPLTIAASQNQIQAFALLLHHGANCGQLDVDNHTTMHLAATEGHNGIIAGLFNAGVSPMFAVSNPRDEAYVPCPLFLAAVSGHSHTVALFTDRDDCPDACKSDATMLLAMHQCFTNQTIGLQELKSKMELSLKVREEKHLSVVYAEPRKEFGYCQEVKTRRELRELWNTPDIQKNLLYQWLLVVERCIGMLQNEMTNTCLQVSCSFIDMGFCYESELLLTLMVEIELASSERGLPSLQVSYPEDTYEHLINVQRIVTDSCVQMITTAGYHPKLFDRYICFGERILGLISRMNAAQNFTRISSEQIALLTLEYFFLWVDSIAVMTDFKQKAEAESFLQAVGEKFVASHLYIDETSLLHIAASSTTTNSNILFLEYLLKWGADEVINLVDDLGRAPIHFSVDLFHLFTSYGAHPDAVTNLEESVYDKLNMTGENQLVPLPLACYAARAIVAVKIPYLSIDLPSPIQSFIKLHDKEHVTKLR